MKKLSVIVPVYNVELYLEECIHSLLKQTYENLEIILVDDGSTDRSGEICENFALMHHNIRVVHQCNQGLPHARNTGIKAASGEYVCFVDSDDRVKSSMYETMIRALEDSEADMSVCNFERFDKTGVHAFSLRYRDAIIELVPGNEEEFFEIAIDSSCNKIYRLNTITENALLFEDKSVVSQEDFWFLVRYCSHISRIATISASLYQYRDRASSITKSGSDNDITERCLNFILLSEEYLQKEKKEVKLFLERLTLDMLFASINQLPKCTVGQIQKTLYLFSKSKYYKGAVRGSERYIKKQHRKRYFSLLFFLLKTRLHLVFSFLEYLRVLRLRRIRKRDTQFA